MTYMSPETINKAYKLVSYQVRSDPTNNSEIGKEQMGQEEKKESNSHSRTS